MTVTSNHAVRHILLIEDNPGDVRLTAEAFRDAGMAVAVHAVETGEDAVHFLFRQRPYADAPTPDLVVLDLNLPGVSGYEVLATMKKDERLKTIPVIVISSSENPADVKRAYADQASVYLRKPYDLDEYFEMVRAIKDIWLKFAILPQLD